MPDSDSFDLSDFTPYLLNLAAETSSLEFQKYYKQKYRMLRTEWRVIFHLGRYGPMHAKQICDRARIHKTKVSRAVTALESKGFLIRQIEDTDRRHALLVLTDEGNNVFQELYAAAQQFDAKLTDAFTESEREVLRKCLLHIAEWEK